MRNWRTTVSAIIAAVAGFVLFSPEHFIQWPVLVSMAKYVMAGGLVSMGILSKDAAVHSTTADVVRADRQESEVLKKQINELQ